MRAEELKGHLDAVLLAALEGGPRHGYAVIEALRQSTDGRLDLPTGTIYPALRRLEHVRADRGNVVLRVAQRPPGHGDPGTRGVVQLHPLVIQARISTPADPGELYQISPICIRVAA